MTEFQPNTEGVFHGLPADVYHNAPGVSHSMLRHLDPPARLPVYLSAPREDTPAMVFGRVVHHLVLTPNHPVFWAVKPDGLILRTSEGKEWRDIHSGKSILSEDDWRDINGCVDAIRAHLKARLIFQAGRAEVSVFQHLGGFFLKGRIDWVPDNSNALVDLKTCRDISTEAFTKSFYTDGYYTQAAHYLDLWNHFTDRKRDSFVFVCVEKEAPYAVKLYEASIVSVEMGRQENAARYATYKRCIERSQWPGYVQEIEYLQLPTWAKAGPRWYNFDWQ